MAKVVYHLTENGPMKCSATKGKCPYASASEHYESAGAARGAFEERMASQTFLSVKRPRPLKEFSMDSYYGDWKPRLVQLNALNGVKEALAEDDKTQLVAACGTGKTYMGRQLMRHFMEQPGANGVAIVLTSSIKLAQDTAKDLRPDEDGEGYDRSIGVYGEDYEVIEVHSSVVMVNGKQSVKDPKTGIVSSERIKNQIQAALDAEKKVVIVSTYDSCGKVQEAQTLLQDPSKAEADILMHDEAHNILGQQTPTSITEAENSAYVGFHNSIPGAIQARKRLYATATPVVEESGDKVSTGDLEHAIQTAERMKSDPKARVTFYSTDKEMIGGVGGAITQKEAIEGEYLAKPVYQLRESLVHGRMKDFRDPRVAPDGSIYEATGEDHELTPQTYAAVTATLNAMTADPEQNANPSHNALVYTGSIAQAEAFKRSYRQIAIHESGNMEVEAAERLRESEDPELRRKARMRLLAEHADVKAAHSRSDSDSRREREEAFEMFKGNDYTEADAAQGWSPNKRILANVDIFSEGVNINEIDTVVISDEAKTSERAMTQAIGRAIRRVSKNPYKSTGHVIIPRVLTEDGVAINDASVAAAAYGATRVERSIALRKLDDEPIKPDETTEIAVYSPQGTPKGKLSARELGQGSLQDVNDVVAAGVVNQAITELRKRPDWKTITESEQNQRIITYLNESASSKTAHRSMVAHHLRGRSHLEVQALRRNSKILGSVLASGDVGALSPKVASALIKHGVLRPVGAVEEGPSTQEKRELLKSNMEAITHAFSSVPVKGNSEHEEIFSRIAEVHPGVRTSFKKYRSNTPFTEEREAIQSLMEDDDFTEKLYNAVNSSDKRSRYARLRQVDTQDSLGANLDSLELTAMNRSHAAASAGAEAYLANRSLLRKTGDLKAQAIAALSSEIR